MSYTLRDYAGIIGDSTRIKAYTAALKKLITPESFVLDIGTGTGVFALIACSLGARRVVAIDTNPAVQLGDKLAKENNFAERITFIEGDSRELSFDETPDIIVSDLRGVLPLQGDALAVLHDAASRIAGEQTIIIPETDRLYVALLESEEVYTTATGSIEDAPTTLSFNELRETLKHSWYRLDYAAGELKSPAALWLEINYATNAATSFSKPVELHVSESATVHGFLIWFDTTLHGTIGYSNAPDTEVGSYDRLFFPFLEPIEVTAGETVLVDIRAELVGTSYVWKWRTVYQDTEFEQSTFYSDLIAAEDLQKHRLTI